MNIKELQNLTVKQLQAKATELGISEYIGLKKQELIKLILDFKVEKDETVYATGVLEVLPDGYGFLRFSNYSYLPGPDDIYVSHSQIKRFRLKTGHLISGQIRPPKDKEKFFALLRVESINGIQPDDARGLVVFDNLTPLYPEELIKLETDAKSNSNANLLATPDSWVLAADTVSVTPLTVRGWLNLKFPVSFVQVKVLSLLPSVDP